MMARFVFLAAAVGTVSALPIEQKTATCTPETCCFDAETEPNCGCAWANPYTCNDDSQCGANKCYTFCCSSKALDCCDPPDEPPASLYCGSCPSPNKDFCEPPTPGECDCSWITSPESCNQNELCGLDKCYTSCCFNQYEPVDCGNLCDDK